MKRDRYLLVIVVLAMVVAGCYETPTRRHLEIDFDGEIVDDDQFRMVGQVEVDTAATSERTFEDVRVTLYDSDESVIRSVSLGEIGTYGSEAPVTQPVNVTATEIPQYVVFESPDFWRDGGLPVIAFRRVDGRYESYTVRSEAEKFPRGVVGVSGTASWRGE